MGSAQAAVLKPVVRERVRGSKLTVLQKSGYSSGVPFEEGLRMADRKDLVIASNSRISKSLVGSREWGTLRIGFSCWTGTLVGNVEPDTTFERGGERSTTLNSHIIRYVDPKTHINWIFIIPEEHLGLSNALLVAEHPDYGLVKDGRDRIVEVDPTKVGVVHAFPTERGWYLADEKYGIPHGSPLDEARHRSSLDSFSYGPDERYVWGHPEIITTGVRPIVRGPGAQNPSSLRGINFNNRPSSNFGIIVEAP